MVNSAIGGLWLVFLFPYSFFSVIIYYHNFLLFTFLLYLFFLLHQYHLLVIIMVLMLLQFWLLLLFLYLTFYIANLYLIIFYIYDCILSSQCQTKCCPDISAILSHNLIWNKWHPLIITSIPVTTPPLNAAHVRNVVII